MEKIDIKLGKYKGLKVKKNKLEVEEQEIKKALDYLQKSRAKIITVNRSAKKGDRVEVDFEIRQGSVKIEDGTSKNHPLILGEARFLPGFEEELEGMTGGEEKEFVLKAPIDWPDKRIASKNLDFKVKMNLVQQRNLPVIDDEFAKSLGNFKSLSEVKKSIKQGLFQEKEIKEKERIRIELIEKIAQDSKIEIPNILIEQELEKMLIELKASIESMSLDFEKYLKEIKKTADELKKDWQKQAEKRVEIALCLQEIAERENIKVSDEEVKEKINQDLKHHPDIKDVEKNIDLAVLKEYTKGVLRNKKVFELLEQEAKIR
jgi:trigger factor